MNIGKRLLAVAGMVRQGSRVADIGTDHAYLPVYLVQEHIAPCAVATDIRRGPVQAALKTVQQAALTDKICVRLGDGLSPVSPDEAEDIVIAGMGGETIVQILSAAPWVQSPHYRLILQPMSKPEQLHQYLLQNGFEIEREFLVADGHTYIVLTAVYTGCPPLTDAFWFWRGAFTVPDGRPYWQKAAVHLKKRAAHDPAAAVYLEIAAKLEQL